MASGSSAGGVGAKFGFFTRHGIGRLGGPTGSLFRPDGTRGLKRRAPGKPVYEDRMTRLFKVTFPSGAHRGLEIQITATVLRGLPWHLPFLIGIRQLWVYGGDLALWSRRNRVERDRVPQVASLLAAKGRGGSERVGPGVSSPSMTKSSVLSHVLAHAHRDHMGPRAPPRCSEHERWKSSLWKHMAIGYEDRHFGLMSGGMMTTGTSAWAKT